MITGKVLSGAVRGLAMAAAMSLAIAPIGAQPAPPAVGINAAVHNLVQLRRGREPLRPAVLRERVILNDEVRTGAASQLQILLMDRSVFTVGANARVAIDRFVFDPARNTRSTAASVTRGAFRFMSGRSSSRPAGPAVVRTPVASIGIRGTIFEGVVGAEAIAIASREAAVGTGIPADPETATLIVLRGPGPQTQGDAAPGAIDVTVGNRTIVLDRPALALYVPRAGADPIGPFEISAEGLQLLSALLRPPPSFAADVLMAARGGPTGDGGQPGALAGTSGGGGESASTAGVRDGGNSRQGVLLTGLGLFAAALAAIVLAGDDDEQPITP